MSWAATSSHSRSRRIRRTQKAQLLLAKVMLDPETQIRFSQKKGSIPARLDLDMSSLDICAQKAVKLLADKNHQVPAAELLSPPAFTGAMRGSDLAVLEYAATTTDAFVAKVADLLKQQF